MAFHSDREEREGAKWSEFKPNGLRGKKYENNRESARAPPVEL